LLFAFVLFLVFVLIMIFALGAMLPFCEAFFVVRLLVLANDTYATLDEFATVVFSIFRVTGRLQQVVAEARHEDGARDRGPRR
jgi:hypothetical protein